MAKFHVKKGDEIVVIAGAEIGKRGKILTVLTKKQRVLVEGVKLVKKHLKPSQQRPQGEIIQLEGSIHISNVALAAEFDARAAKRAGSTAKP
jgi:large subunit ribosomal protein L24